MSEPTNPYKPNDKVFTKVKGEEVEATVRLVWKEEVQVRVPGGSLLWRTVRTVRTTASPVVETPPAPLSESGPIIEAGDASAVNAGETPAEVAAAPESPVEAEATVANIEAAEMAESLQPNSNDAEQLACGVPEVEADRKQAKKNKRRR